MTAEAIFSFANTTALAGWLLLILAGRAKWAAPLVTGVVLPGLFAVLYVALLVSHWGEGSGGFGSLTAVAALFSNRWVLLAGWIHYLAFDLFIGSWQVRDARRLGIPHLMVVPCLALTFLFGPAGLLCYLILKAARTRRIVLAEN